MNVKKLMRLNNSVDAATSSIHWGKRAKQYRGVAGKGGKTLNAEIKEKKED